MKSADGSWVLNAVKKALTSKKFNMPSPLRSTGQGWVEHPGSGWLVLQPVPVKLTIASSDRSLCAAYPINPSLVIWSRKAWARALLLAGVWFDRLIEVIGDKDHSAIGLVFAELIERVLRFACELWIEFVEPHIFSADARDGGEVIGGLLVKLVIIIADDVCAALGEDHEITHATDDSCVVGDFLYEVDHL